MTLRDRLVLKATAALLHLASPRARARITIAIIRGQGGEPSARLLAQADLSRGPGE